MPYASAMRRRMLQAFVALLGIGRLVSASQADALRCDDAPSEQFELLMSLDPAFANASSLLERDPSPIQSPQSPTKPLHCNFQSANCDNSPADRQHLPPRHSTVAKTSAVGLLSNTLRVPPFSPSPVFAAPPARLSLGYLRGIFRPPQAVLRF